MEYRELEEHVLREGWHVTMDSRRVKPGDVFVALIGQVYDGHDFVHEACRKGARVVVAQHPLADGTPAVLVPDTHHALATLAAAEHRNPSSELRVVGITGTNGKTTSSYLLRSIFAAAGEQAEVVGTLTPAEPGEPSQTTPSSPRLQAMLRKLKDARASTVVLEVSSHGLDQHRVDAVSFDGAGLTNVTRDHLDYHRSLRDYAATKMRLFDLLAQSEVGKPWPKIAGLPLGRYGDMAASRVPEGAVVRFGIARGSVRARKIEFGGWRARFDLVLPNGSVLPVDFPFIGIYNVRNALLAAALAYGQGVEAYHIAQGLSQCSGVPGRLERLQSPGGVYVVIDYAHNPDGLRALYTAIEHQISGRVIGVFGGRGGRDRGKLPLMGEIAARHVAALILTTDSPGDDDPKALAEAVRRGIPPDSRVRVEYVAERQDAIERALSLAKPGDCVVVSGRGPEETFRVGGRLLKGADREFLSAILDRF